MRSPSQETLQSLSLGTSAFKSGFSYFWWALRAHSLRQRSPIGLKLCHNRQMRVPFSLKLAFSVSLLAFVVVGSSLLYFYQTTEDILLEQMTSRLRDVGQTGSFLIDSNSRADIQKLQRMLLEQSTSRGEVAAEIEEGDYETLFDEETLGELHQNSDFQNLVQSLRRIRSGSSNSLQPFGYIPQLPDNEAGLPDINFAYIMAPIPESANYAVQMFIADSDYETIDQNENGAIEPEEEGNPIGTLYAPRTGDPFFMRPYEDGKTHVATDWYTDQWGTFLTVAVPIVNELDEVIAILGLDLLVTNQANRLRELRNESIGVLIASMLLSILFSVFLARLFSRPVAKLTEGARRLRERDFSEHIQIHNRDEFGELAITFNDMMDTLGAYAEDLEQKISERTRELEGANRTIRRINKDLTIENVRLGAEVEVARKLQMMVLPSQQELDQIPGLQIAAYMDPADEVGGDYYDVLLTDRDLIKIGIGDVCGHGLESGVVMLMVQTAVRTVLLSGHADPESYYDLVNRVIFKNLHRISSDKSMTLSLIDYHDDGRMTVTGQHEELIIVRKDGTLERLDTVDLGIPIGLDDGIEAFLGRMELTLDSGDLLLLHTDGVTEAENPQGDYFGLDRLCELIACHHQKPAARIISILTEALEAFMAEREVLDDITLVVLKRP